MTDYLTREEYGRKALDLQAFAGDLAKELGGSVVKPDVGWAANDRYAAIALDGYKLSITAGWRSSDLAKVTVGIDVVGLDYKGQAPSGDYRMPDATVSTTRPIKAIAADVKRRVIEPAKAPTDKRREYAAKQTENANNLAKEAERLRLRYPTSLDVKVERGETYSGSIWGKGGPKGHYLHGRVYNNGTVSIERIGTLTAAQFDGIMAVLYPKT